MWVYVSWYMCGGQLEIHSSHQVGLGDWTLVVGVGGSTPVRWVILLAQYTFTRITVWLKCSYALEMYSLRLNSMLTIFRHHSSVWKAHNFKDTLLAYPSIMNWLLEWNCWSSRGSASRKDFRLVLKSLYQHAFQLTVLSTYILWSALYGIIVNPQPI